MADYFIKHATAVLPFLLKGAVYTLQITILAVFFGTLIGLFIGMGKLAKNKLINLFSTAYVDIIRGTPLLVQVFIIYFGVPNLVGQITGGPFRMEPMVAAVIAFSINSGAYVAEIFRAGIQSIEKGQIEAARSLGMTSTQAMRFVILPQAFRRVIPPLGNEIIALMKDTSILFAIGVQELVGKGQLYIANTYAAFPVYLSIALIYLILTMAVSRIVSYMERRLKVK